MLIAAALKSAFAFPLLIGPGVVGVLEFFSRSSEPPDARLSKIMLHLGAQLGRVVERQQAQEALRQSEIYFRRLTESSLDLITILGPDGIIRYESSSIEQTLGYKPSEYTGKARSVLFIRRTCRASPPRSWKRSRARGTLPC